MVAAAHAHSLYGKAWSSLGRLLDPLTQDACAFHGKHALFDNFTGVVLEASEGARIAATLGPSNVALILQNHGLLTVGRTVEAAVWRFIALDNAAHAQLLAEAAGTPGPFPGRSRTPHARWAPNSAAGSASSPTGTACCATSPTSSTDCKEHP